MKQALSIEYEKFRVETQEFLNTYLTADLRARSQKCAGVFADHDVAMEWHKILHQHGRIAPSWPREYGGTGWDIVEQYIWNTESALADAPRLPAMSLKMCGPVLMQFGTPEQKQEFLPRILSGDDFWCQGYSEPGAGSDLAALQCKARREGDEYIVNGTKIWTTYAQFANWIFCLVRTMQGERPQQGISFLLIPMDTPGITIDPIITLAGEHEVNQVFFDEVRVPAANLVGAENEGWNIAKFLLQHERSGTYSGMLRNKLQVLKNIVQQSGMADHQDALQAISELEISILGLDVTEQRIFATLAEGGNVTMEPSMLKLQGTEVQQKIDMLAVELCAHDAVYDYRQISTSALNMLPHAEIAQPIMGQYLNNRAATIYGGSSEVQRNIIGKIAIGG